MATMRSGLVRAVKQALLDVDVHVLRRGRLSDPECGRDLKGLYQPEGNRITVAVRAHASFDDLVLTLLHEALHALPKELPEYIADEALDRIVFTSPSLRWLAARILGDILCGY